MTLALGFLSFDLTALGFPAMTFLRGVDWVTDIRGLNNSISLESSQIGTKCVKIFLIVEKSGLMGFKGSDQKSSDP